MIGVRVRTLVEPPKAAAAERTYRRWMVGLAILGLALLALTLRVAVGTQQPLDGDQATEGITALRILHGHLALMESSGRYVGALDSYLLAPALAAMGPTLLAVRLVAGVLGAAYVVIVYALARACFGRATEGLVAAAVATAFPLYALTFGVLEITYSLVLVLQAVLLLLAVRLAWPRRAPRWPSWSLGGFAAGVAMWAHPLLAIPTAAGLAAVLVRGPVNGWRRTLAGLAIALATAVAGFAPWLIYNLVVSPLGSLRHIYAPAVAYRTSPGVAAHELVAIALPIFVGARVDGCGASTPPVRGFQVGLAALCLAVLWLRRRSLVALAKGRLTALEPVDFVLAVAVPGMLAVTVGYFNALFCQPRYLMPLAVPLVLAATTVLSAAWPWRALGLALAAVWLVAAGGTIRATIAPGPNVIMGPAAAAAVSASDPEALWADYWLARPLQFYAGDRFVVGEYGGYVGFPDTQGRALAAAHPSWLFSAGDPKLGAFRQECARRGITYRESHPAPALVLLSDLSRALTPDDLHFGGQRPDRV